MRGNFHAQFLGGCGRVNRPHLPGLRHEVAFDTAWLERSPDQVLRVAAGIPRKHASGGLGPRGRYCQRCGAFPEMYQTWQPQAGRELELEDMVKLAERS